MFLNTLFVFLDRVISFNLNLACGFVDVLKITKAEFLARLLHE